MIDVHAIEEGFRRNEFFLEYLPTVSLNDGRCVGAEALTRWRRPSGIVFPGEFVPLLENTPHSGVLTYWVMDTIAAELSDWLRANPDLHISLNVPPEILGRGGLDYAARKSGLSEFTRQLILEITERGLPDTLGLQGLAYAPGQGARVALDDVTMTGANLAILARCPFQIIKIDRATVGQIITGKPPPEWLQGLATLLIMSRLEVIAEGVESPVQVEVLRDAGVQFGQGFYFSQPLSAAALFEFHAQRNA